MPHDIVLYLNVLSTWANSLDSWGVTVPDVYKRPTANHISSLIEVTVQQDIKTDSKRQQFMTGDVRPLFMAVGDFNIHIQKPPNSSSAWAKANLRMKLELVFKSLQIAPIPMEMSECNNFGTRGPSIIDYICLPEDWLLRVYKFIKRSLVQSDHLLVEAQLRIFSDPFQKSPYWKFKNVLLSDTLFVNKMSLFIKELLKIFTQGIDLLMQWDYFKLQVLTYARTFWQNNKARLLANVSSPIKFRPVKKIHFLKDPVSGSITGDNQRIVDIMANFYANLYTSNSSLIAPPSEMCFGMATISPDLLEELELEFSVNELGNALVSLSPNKVPGVDGLTVEFYAKFWELIAPYFLSWMRQVTLHGKLTGSAAQGIIALIPKKGDPRNVDNWRPIVLMNVDTKIVLKAIKNRLAPVLSDLLPHYQSVLPGRTILDSLATIRDFISVCKLSKTPLFILALDQRKAFDNVCHAFLFHILKCIGLPTSMISLIRSFYSGFECSVKNASALSYSFPYMKGVRQGDPLATSLYALALQPVLNALHIVIEQQPFPFLGEQQKTMIAYADDVTLFLPSNDAIRHIIDTFNYIARYSGAHLNLDKSILAPFFLPVNNPIKCMQTYQGISVSHNVVNVLGIMFTSDGKIHDSQWTSLTATTKCKIASASSQLIHLSYWERASWVSRKLWPSWAYLLKVLQPSKLQLQQLSVLLVDAIWLGSKHWLSPQHLVLPMNAGGLQFPAVSERIEAYRIMHLTKCISSGPDSMLFSLAEIILDHYAEANLGFRILHSIPDLKHLSDIPLFYQAAFQAWNKLPTCFFPDSKDTFAMLPAFNSKPLQEITPMFGLTTTQAITWKSFTINQFLKMKHSQSRNAYTLTMAIDMALTSWQPTTPPTCLNNCKHKDTKSSSWSLSRVPNFYLAREDSFIHSCSWNNKTIYRLLISIGSVRSADQIPPDTWVILQRSIVPTVFKNRYWRFLHSLLPTSNFFNKLKILDAPQCVLCGSQDTSDIHQFETCPVLNEVNMAVHRDIKTLGVVGLPDFHHLYTESTIAYRLSNFLLITYIYAISEIIKSLANYSCAITGLTIMKAYYSAIARHLTFLARCHPPSSDSNNVIWSIFTYRGLIAKLTPSRTLVIRTAQGFLLFDINSGNLV